MYGQKSVTITVCDNGWVVEWNNPADLDVQNSFQGERRRRDSGKEVFTKEKDMLAFVKGKV